MTEPAAAASLGGRVAGFALAAALIATAWQAAGAEEPLLQQLSDETQHLYARARGGMVRVRLPTPPWLARENQRLMAKWGAQLDPAFLQQILRDRERAVLTPRAATGPATGPAGRPGLTITVIAGPDRVLVATGLLLDPAGHAVFPLYLDPSELPPGTTLAALAGDGRPTVAAFVGSDRFTNLTVLKLADPGDHPTLLTAPPTTAPDTAPAAGRPADGSLSLVVAPDGSARLAVWSPASADVGLVLRPDGSFAGFGFENDFLPMDTARPVLDQLVATGGVHRRPFGVAAEPVHRSDLTADPAGPGGPFALRVTDVEPGSTADRGHVLPGDVILSVAGQPVGPRTFAAVIAGRRGAVPIRVRRGSVTRELTVTLGAD